MYFEECTGASVGAGDEVSGVGESEGVVDGEGEFWLFLAQHTTPCLQCYSLKEVIPSKRFR